MSNNLNVKTMKRYSQNLDKYFRLFKHKLQQNRAG